MYDLPKRKFGTSNMLVYNKKLVSEDLHLNSKTIRKLVQGVLFKSKLWQVPKKATNTL